MMYLGMTKKEQNGRGGGVIIAAKKYLHASLCNYNNTHNLNINGQSIFIKIQLYKEKLIIGDSYFPPDSPIECYLNYLDHLSLLKSTYSNCTLFLGGDFNLPHIGWSAADYFSF